MSRLDLCQPQVEDGGILGQQRVRQSEMEGGQPMVVVPACLTWWGFGCWVKGGGEQHHKGSVVLSHWSGGFPGKHRYSGSGPR